MRDWRSETLPHVHEVEKGQFILSQYGSPELLDVRPAEWTHLYSARFGDGRPCGRNPKDQTCWTGDSHRYDVYTMNREHRDHLVAVRWSHGGGDGWLITEDKARRGEANLLLLIGQVESEAARWDHLHLFCEAIDYVSRKAASATSAELKVAFIEGRLKKRKQRGNAGYKVEILSKAMPAT